MGFFDGIIGGIASVFGANSAAKQAEAARRQQEDFAKHGIQYKVDDAKAAGINPYAALGASTSMPAAVTGDTSGYGVAGQNIGRALDALNPQEQRNAELDTKIKSAQLDNQNLINAGLASELATRSSGAPPARPTLDQSYLVDGQGAAKRLKIVVPVGDKLIKQEPQKITPSDPTLAGVAPGTVNDYAFSRDPSGNLYPIPSKEVMEAQSNDMLGMLSWNVRNRIMPAFGYGKQYVPDTRDGKKYRFNPWLSRYEPN